MSSALWPEAAEPSLMSAWTLKQCLRLGITLIDQQHQPALPATGLLPLAGACALLLSSSLCYLHSAALKLTVLGTAALLCTSALHSVFHCSIVHCFSALYTLLSIATLLCSTLYTLHCFTVHSTLHSTLYSASTAASHEPAGGVYLSLYASNKQAARHMCEAVRLGEGAQVAAAILTA